MEYQLGVVVSLWTSNNVFTLATKHGRFSMKTFGIACRWWWGWAYLTICWSLMLMQVHPVLVIMPVKVSVYRMMIACQLLLFFILGHPHTISSRLWHNSSSRLINYLFVQSREWRHDDAWYTFPISTGQSVSWAWSWAPWCVFQWAANVGDE